MNATRQRTNLRSFFSSIPIPKETQAQTTGKQRRLKKPTKAPLSTNPKKHIPPYRKKKISGALREAVWIKTMGRAFEGKCPVTWCPNTITVFDFQGGHNIPESKGGTTTLPNLIAICSRCNLSMGNQYTIDEWNAMHAPGTQLSFPSEKQVTLKKQTFFQRLCCCFFRKSN